VASPRGGHVHPTFAIEVAPEIYTNPTSFFFRGRGRTVGGRSNENEANLLLPLRTQKIKVFSFRETSPL